MLAAINRKHECVWGVGRTAAEARADAYQELRKKGLELRQEGIEPLEFAPLKPNADLTDDGMSLYQDVMLDQETVQMGMEF